MTYVNGTVPGLSQGVQGSLDATQIDALVFQSGDTRFAMPYTRITAYEYRQDTGFRLGILPAMVVPLVKPRAKVHFVIINWLGDRGTQEVVTLQMSKATSDGLMTVLRPRSSNRCPDRWAAGCGRIR